MRVGTLLASLRRVLEKHRERNLAVDYQEVLTMPSAKRQAPSTLSQTHSTLTLPRPAKHPFAARVPPLPFSFLPFLYQNLLEHTRESLPLASAEAAWESVP